MVRVEDMLQKMLRRFEAIDENVKEMRKDLHWAKGGCTFDLDQASQVTNELVVCHCEPTPTWHSSKQHYPKPI